jgi:hypothetical protein
VVAPGLHRVFVLEAQPGFGAATTDQAMVFVDTIGMYSRIRSTGCIFTKRSGSRPSMIEGFGLPVSEMSAGLSSFQARMPSISCGKDLPSISSGCSSAAARARCWSPYSMVTLLAPTRYASAANARATGACSTWPMMTTRCPGWTLTPTRTTRRA